MPIRINPAVAAIPYGDRKKLKTLVAGREGLADLMSGNPCTPMPPFIRDRLRESLDSGLARYTDYWGLAELRRRLSAWLQSECGVEADPEESLIITHGVQEALYVVFRTVLRAGDQVLIPSPHYANYLLNTVACGAEPVFVPLAEDEGFIPDIRRLRSLITPRARLLVFSNPNNPLGVVWPEQILRELAETAREHDLLVVADEIYRDFAAPGPPRSIASLPGMKERTFTCSGFSKSCFMMGLRVGYLAGPAEAVFHIKQLHYLITLCPSLPGQVAALAALECPREQLEPLHREYRETLEHLYRGVAALPGVSCVRPGGSFYVFPNLRRCGRSSLELAVELVEQAGVMTLPGTEFGSLGEGYLRLSVAAGRKQVEEGLGRLTRYMEERGPG